MGTVSPAMTLNTSSISGTPPRFDPAPLALASGRLRPERRYHPKKVINPEDALNGRLHDREGIFPSEDNHRICTPRGLFIRAPVLIHSELRLTCTGYILPTSGRVPRPRDRRSGYFILYVIVWRCSRNPAMAVFTIRAAHYDRFCLT